MIVAVSYRESAHWSKFLISPLKLYFFALKVLGQFVKFTSMQGHKSLHSGLSLDYRYESTFRVEKSFFFSSFPSPNGSAEKSSSQNPSATRSIFLVSATGTTASSNESKKMVGRLKSRQHFPSRFLLPYIKLGQCITPKRRRPTLKPCKPRRMRSTF